MTPPPSNSERQNLVDKGRWRRRRQKAAVLTDEKTVHGWKPERKRRSWPLERQFWTFDDGLNFLATSEAIVQVYRAFPLILFGAMSPLLSLSLSLFSSPAL